MTEETKKNEKITKENLYTGFKVLLRYLSRYRKDIIILSIMGVLSAIGNGVIPYVAGKFFDSIITLETITILDIILPLYLVFLILWTVIQLITYIFDWRIQIKSDFLAEYIWMDYMSNGFGFLLNLPISFHKKNKIGEIGGKINLAAGALNRIASQIVIDQTPQILSIIIALVVAFILNPLLATFLVIGLIVYLFILYKNTKPVGGYQKEYFEKVNQFYGDAYDMIGNTIAVKQATTEEYEREKINKHTKDMLPLWMKQTKVWGALSMYQRITILCTQILIFVFSIYYIHLGVMTLGELLTLNAYAAMMFGPFIAIARNWQTIQNGIISIQETEKILASDTENYEPKHSKEFEIQGNISFDNVSFQYDEGKSVLLDISFSVKAGEVVALVGESGVGKSTIADLLSAYHFPTNGKVTIDDQPIESLNLKSLRSQIAVVPQEVVLFNDTIKNNIKYGNFHTTDEQMENAAKKAYAYDFIEKFPNKWEQIVGERGIKLSVGQKQRIAIARAILRNPRILILDEPTAALDAGSEKIISESLDELMKSKTTFIIAHRLSTVRRADKILVFKNGRLIESGKHNELIMIENGEYRRLYELQIGLHK